MQFNLNTHNQLCQYNIKDTGAWFPKDKGGSIQTFEPMGKIQMSKGKPIKLSTTFPVLFTQSFIIARNWLS